MVIWNPVPPGRRISPKALLGGRVRLEEAEFFGQAGEFGDGMDLQGAREVGAVKLDGALVDAEVIGECRQASVKAYLGGSCAETELSARVAVHVAVATQADVQLAKPGMGVDEGLMIVQNEQTRLLAELRQRLA